MVAVDVKKEQPTRKEIRQYTPHTVNRYKTYSRKLKEGGDMYSDDLKRAVQFLTAIHFILKMAEEHPTDYPLLMKAYTVMAYGYKPKVNVQCPHCDGKFVIELPPIGGLDDALDCFEEAIEWLTLETNLEEVSSDEVPDAGEGGDAGM